MHISKIGFAVALTLVSVVAQAEVDVLTVGRCGNTWKDSLEQGAPTEGRIAFALKCEKNEIVKYHITKHASGTHREGGGPITKGYPTYGYFDVAKGEFTNPKDYVAPTSDSGSCDAIPPGYQVAFFCASGCYSPEQGLLFVGGYENLVDAKSKGLGAIVSVSAQSTLEELKLQESRLGEIIGDIGSAAKASQRMLHFVMASGGELKITLNHPLVTADGKMRRADELAKGDLLVRADGTLDPIKDIVEYTHAGKVYNVSVDSSDPKEQIVIAQGYLNGSLYYQNEGVRELNRKLLRTSVAANFIQ